jgi:hypothetical protein
VTERRSSVKKLADSMIGAILVAGTLILSPVLRSWYNRWGATEEELDRTLPGDDLVPKPDLGYTHAIPIHARAADIWPWLVQIGQGRGGLYSYEGLENLAGCKIRNVDRVMPEFQDLKVGDLVRLGPQGYPCFVVETLEPGQALVLQGADPETGEPPDLAAESASYALATWQFILDERDEAASRLIIRQRLAYSQDMALLWRLVEPISFVMERNMMLTLKRHVERAVAQGRV